jgi:UDP-N-acetylmuramoylalanine-D-glutamate ligase
MKQVINCTTGEIVDRELNEDELAQSVIDAENVAIAQAQSAEKAAAKQAVLDKLGLTAEELAAALS